MKKFLLSFFVVLAFGFYVALKQAPANYEYVEPAAPTVVPSEPLALKNKIPKKKANPSKNPPTNPPISPAVGSPQTLPVKTYKDGEYIGKIADAYYGNVQVKVVIQGGKITGVQFLDYPSDRKKSLEISKRAMPRLKTEAIQAQKANVNIVSGATLTSIAFRESLSSALKQAKN